jgi:hypothetical protein
MSNGAAIFPEGYVHAAFDMDTVSGDLQDVEETTALTTDRAGRSR